MKEYRNKGYAQQAIVDAEKLYGPDHWCLDTVLQEKGNLHLMEGEDGQAIAYSYTADPNTHLLYPKTTIPAVEYRIGRGRSVLKTVVYSKWF